MLLPFVQLELAGAIGLPEGRYLAREGDAEHVLIVQVIGTPRHSGRRRRPKAIKSGSTSEVPLSRVTVTGGQDRDLGDGSEAKAWLEGAAGDAETRAAEVRAATRIVNRALNALRAEARDPLVQEIGATRALSIRLGYGTGDQLSEGRWTEAVEIPPPRRGRLDDVDPQTRVAAVLAGRDEVHPAETLLLRARLDQQQGREAEARHGLRAARAALDEQPIDRDAKLREQFEALEEKLGA